ncbi:polyprenyl synthetase family protein [Salinivirga cyanobacteriivorans]
MSKLNTIKQPISKEMADFQVFFKSTMKSTTPLLDIITRFILRTKGKQMRPMLVFLSAGMHGKINDATHHAAALIELMHTATLTHDDVVDDSNFRRGFFSINALWKNKIAVLIGDYLLARGLLLSVKHKQYHLLEVVSKAVDEMSQGELLQIEKARKLNIDEAVYFKIIEQKTAALIAACVKAGAISVNAPENTVEAMEQFGLKLGMAFQIKDDLFDYEPNGLTGKPSGNDIKEKKMTLPLIHVKNLLSAKERRQILRLIKKKRKTKKEVLNLIQLVDKHGGITYARQKMEEYKNGAIDILKQFPESEYKNSLLEIVEYTVSRKK